MEGEAVEETPWEQKPPTATQLHPEQGVCDPGDQTPGMAHLCPGETPGRDGERPASSLPSGNSMQLPRLPSVFPQGCRWARRAWGRGASAATCEARAPLWACSPPPVIV